MGMQQQSQLTCKTRFACAVSALLNTAQHLQRKANDKMTQFNQKNNRDCILLQGLNDREWVGQMHRAPGRAIFIGACQDTGRIMINITKLMHIEQE